MILGGLGYFLKIIWRFGTYYLAGTQCAIRNPRASEAAWSLGLAVLWELLSQELVMMRDVIETADALPITVPNETRICSSTAV
jgi:hypothetical protein